MSERSSGGLAGGWQISTTANVTTFVPAAEELRHLLARLVLATHRVTGVAEAIRAERDDLVEVSRGEHAGRWEPAELAGVLTDLLRGADVLTDQLQRGILDDRPQRFPSGQTGPTVHDSDRHVTSSSEKSIPLTTAPVRPARPPS